MSAFAGCSGDEPGVAPNADAAGSTNDSSGDAKAADEAETNEPHCDVNAPFTSSRKLEGLSSDAAETRATLSIDELEIFFTRRALSDAGNDEPTHVFRATRARRSDDFGAPTEVTQQLTAAGGPSLFGDPSLTGDQKSLYIAAKKATVGAGWDIYVATRAGPEAVFGAPTIAPGLSDPSTDISPSVTAAEDEIFFVSSRPDGLSRLHHASRVAGSFGEVKLVSLSGAFGTDATIVSPTISADGLTLYFGASNPSAGTPLEIWMARRASRNGELEAATKVNGVNIGLSQQPSWLSTDQCRLYVAQNRGTGTSLDYFVFERSL